MAETATSKICIDCGVEKPLDDFAFHKKGGTTRRASCRDCLKDYLKEYGKRQYVKDRHRAYQQRPEVKEKAAVRNKEYINRPEVRARREEYRNRPEVIAHKKSSEKEYRNRPEVIAYRKARDKEYSHRPEIRAKRRIYRQSPEVKARDEANRNTPEARARQKVYRDSPEAKARLKNYAVEARKKVIKEIEGGDFSGWVKKVLYNTRARAKKYGWDFNLTAEDFTHFPEICPVLGIRLTYIGRASLTKKGTQPGFWPNSASIDRIDNSKGYLKGNVIIISNRANALKSDATVEELMAISDFYLRQSI